MLLNLTIDFDNLDLAASQLWNFLSPHILYLTKKEHGTIKLAFDQMVIAHNQQRRKSGDFYILHPVQACHTLAEMQLDAESLAACLLHDVPEDTNCSLEDLSETFSPEILFLVSGVTKLSVIKYRGNDIYAKNLQRLFVAMSQDLRVILIKLADRIHNLTTLSALIPEKAARIALESLEIYLPIAKQLGIHRMSRAIEVYALPYISPTMQDKFSSISEPKVEQEDDLYYKFGYALLWSRKLIPAAKKKIIFNQLSKTSIPWLNQLVSLGNQDLKQDIYLQRLVTDLNHTFA